MPYISQSARKELKRGNLCNNVGELNYAVTQLIDQWLRDRGVGYSTINEAIGVLECAKLELYRRIAAPYEDQKLAASGDAYTCRN